MYDLMLALINYAIAEGAALEKDKDIYKDYTPEDPNTCITIREYAGTPGAWYSEMGVRSIQVEVRSKSTQEGFQKIWNMYNVYRPKEEISNIGGQDCIITMRNTPVKVGMDANKRHQYSFNMGITTKIH